MTPAPDALDRRRADLTAEIDTGDHVYHKPTRETWLVRRVSVGHLYWCGWPPGVAALSDCRLVYKATPTERGQLQAELSRSLHEAAE